MYPTILGPIATSPCLYLEHYHYLSDYQLLIWLRDTMFCSNKCTKYWSDVLEHDCKTCFPSTEFSFVFIYIMVDVEMNGNAINILFIYLSIYLLLLFVYFLISHSEGWLDFSSKALIKDFGFLDFSKKKNCTNDSFELRFLPLFAFGWNLQLGLSHKETMRWFKLVLAATDLWAFSIYKWTRTANYSNKTIL